MFYNIPTILILDAKIEKFRPNAKKFYKALNKNNILFMIVERKNLSIKLKILLKTGGIQKIFRK